MKEIIIRTSEVNLVEMEFTYKIKVDESTFEETLLKLNELEDDHEEIYQTIFKYEHELIQDEITDYIECETQETEVISVEAR